MKGNYMNTRKIRRQCMVPGCRNYETYMIHKTRDPWPTVIMCKECVKDAYFSLNEGVKISEAKEPQAKAEEKKTEAEKVEKIKEIPTTKPKTTKKATGK